jgi:hypothetical protein
MTTNKQTNRKEKKRKIRNKINPHQLQFRPLHRSSFQEAIQIIHGQE